MNVYEHWLGESYDVSRVKALADDPQAIGVPTPPGNIATLHPSNTSPCQSIPGHPHPKRAFMIPSTNCLTRLLLGGLLQRMCRVARQARCLIAPLLTLTLRLVNLSRAGGGFFCLGARLVLWVGRLAAGVGCRHCG